MLNIDVENIVVSTDVGHFMVRMNVDLMFTSCSFHLLSKYPFGESSNQMFSGNVHSLGGYRFVCPQCRLQCYQRVLPVPK